VGTCLGPVVGGAFEKVTWRWAFYINLCFGALFAPVWLFLLPSIKHKSPMPFRTKLASFDFLGTLLITGALLPLVLAINFGGTLFSWNSGASIALFVLSAVLLTFFLLQQGFTIATNPAERLFPMHFLKNKDAVLLAVIAAASDVVTFVPIYYIPLYFQFVRGDDSIQSAVRLLPYITFLSATILANGYCMGKFGHVKPWYIVGSALALAASAVLCKLAITSIVNSMEVLRLIQL
jgi:MFS family permease